MVPSTCLMAMAWMVLAASMAFAQATRPSDVTSDIASDLSIIPLPQSIERRAGAFRLTAATKLATKRRDDAAAAAAKFLRERLAIPTGLPLESTDSDGKAAMDGAILITTEGGDPALGREGYTLEVTPAAVVIRSIDAAGLFYGVQSLLQLLPPSAYGSTSADATWSVPALVIRDQPRFAWRGGMLDVGRHLFKKEEIFRLIDAIAMHKGNVFHWHLTEDQGWRIQIARYPKLTEVGAWRENIGWGLDPKSSDHYDANGRYGGFFTQDEVREVVAYAAERHITVVPEIEMPGHSMAALASYPELSCTGGEFKVTSEGGVFDSVYCAGNEETFKFLEAVLEEVLPLFPSPYIHIGGDEAPKERWKECPKCQARIKAEGLKDQHELQSYFIRRMEKFINAHGKKIIGWDEILEGGLAPNATVMSWRGVKGGIAAAKAGHHAVMTPTTHCYLDYHQSDSGEAEKIGQLLPLEKVYSYEPVPPELTAEESKHILGVQGNLWTEHIASFRHAGYMFFPRHTALAEIGWSKEGPRDFVDFQRRLKTDERRLDAMGLSYRPLPPAGLEESIWRDAEGKVSIAVPGEEGLEAHYTTDGADPTRESQRYERPIAVPASGVALVRARFYRPGTIIGHYHEQMFLDGLPVKIETSFRQYQNHGLAGAFDDDERSFFWHGRPVRKDDHLTIRFAAPRAVRSIRVVTGKTDGGGDRLIDGVLEVSRAGGAFAEVATFRDGSAEVELDGGPVEAVRIRAIEASKEWLVVRQITLR